eukprot:3752593-Alexandrium_andersonii.AAC.1
MRWLKNKKRSLALPDLQCVSARLSLCCGSRVSCHARFHRKTDPDGGPMLIRLQPSAPLRF